MIGLILKCCALIKRPGGDQEDLQWAKIILRKLDTHREGTSSEISATKDYCKKQQHASDSTGAATTTWRDLHEQAQAAQVGCVKLEYMADVFKLTLRDLIDYTLYGPPEGIKGALQKLDEMAEGNGLDISFPSWYDFLSQDLVGAVGI